MISSYNFLRIIASDLAKIAITSFWSWKAIFFTTFISLRYIAKLNCVIDRWKLSCKNSMTKAVIQRQWYKRLFTREPGREKKRNGTILVPLLYGDFFNRDGLCGSFRRPASFVEQFMILSDKTIMNRGATY